MKGRGVDEMKSNQRIYLHLSQERTIRGERRSKHRRIVFLDGAGIIIDLPSARLTSD